MNERDLVEAFVELTLKAQDKQGCPECAHVESPTADGCPRHEGVLSHDADRLIEQARDWLIRDDLGVGGRSAA